MKNNLLVFASTPSRIPIFPTNTLTICRIEANQLELFVFLTLCGSKSNNYSTLMQCRFIYSNNTNNNSSNNSKMAEVRFSIFKICFENGWNSIFNICFDILFLVEYFNLEPPFFALPTIQLGYSRSVLCLDQNLEAGPRFAGIWLIGLTKLCSVIIGWLVSKWGEHDIFISFLQELDPGRSDSRCWLKRPEIFRPGSKNSFKTIHSGYRK